MRPSTLHPWPVLIFPLACFDPQGDPLVSAETEGTQGTSASSTAATGWTSSTLSPTSDESTDAGDEKMGESGPVSMEPPTSEAGTTSSGSTAKGDYESSTTDEPRDSSGDGDETTAACDQTICDSVQEYCDAICDSGKCVIVAADNDHDGYGSAECALAPGEDCDDNHGFAHPGGIENVCDGIDADCDGVPDIEEGYPLGGIVTSVGVDASRDQAGAWSSELGVFGIYHVDLNGPYEQRFSTVDESGIRSDPVVLGTTHTYSSVLAAGHGGFAHIYSISGFYLQRRDATGRPAGPARLLVSSAGSVADIIATNLGWIAAWRTGGVNPLIEAQAFNTDGSPATISSVDVGPTTGSGGPSVASLGGEVVVAFVDEEGVISVRRYSNALVPLGAAISAGVGRGADPVIETIDDGYALVWQSEFEGVSNVYVYAELDAQGVLRCGPVSLGFDSVTPGDPVAAAIAPFSDGVIVAHPSDNATSPAAVLTRVHPGCEVQEFRNSASNTGGLKGRFSLERGEENYWLMWFEPSGTDGYFRIFGSNICD